MGYEKLSDWIWHFPICSDSLNYKAALEIFKYLVKDLKLPKKTSLEQQHTIIFYLLLYLIVFTDLGQLYNQYLFVCFCENKLVYIFSWRFKM